MAIIHDSWDKIFRNPFGACECGKTVTLGVFISDDENVKSVSLRLWTDGETILYPTSTDEYSYDGNQGRLYKFEVTMPSEPCLLWYYFIINTPDSVLYCSGDHGKSQIFNSPPDSYQITVYKEQGEKKWFTSGVMYQIFPDRFYCSSRSDFLERAVKRINMGRRTYIHESWNEEVISEPFRGEKYYIPCDFYGGDLYGIAEKLPYLAELGVSCIYMNPIFESPSNHRYDTSDYMTVDVLLGGNDGLQTLKNECDKFGIRLMLDGVFSHTGADSIYFNSENRYNSVGAYNSKESKYYNWYSFINYPDEYVGWWGFKNLPEVDEDNEEYAGYIDEVIKKYECSWRLDVADELTDKFIKRLRRTANSVNKDAVIIGEVWEDASNKHSKGMRRGYVNGDELDGAMNYPLRNITVDYLTGKMTASETAYRLNSQKENYPKSFYNSCMNMLTTHDTERIMTALKGDKRDVMLAMQIIATLPGVPCIYYGDEIGMEGMRDPFCRRPFEWDKTENNPLLDRCRLLFKTRRSEEALNSGEVIIGAHNELLMIFRFTESHVCLSVINATEQERTLTIDCGITECEKLDQIPVILSAFDILSGIRYTFKDMVLLKIMPHSSVLLVGKGVFCRE